MKLYLPYPLYSAVTSFTLLKPCHYSLPEVSFWIIVILPNTTLVTDLIRQHLHRKSLYSGPLLLWLPSPTINFILFWSCTRPIIINNRNSCITTNSNIPLSNHYLLSPSLDSFLTAPEPSIYHFFTVPHVSFPAYLHHSLLSSWSSCIHLQFHHLSLSCVVIFNG